MCKTLEWCAEPSQKWLLQAALEKKTEEDDKKEMQEATATLLKRLA